VELVVQTSAAVMELTPIRRRILIFTLLSFIVLC